jgi:hypothetical protein
LRRIYLNEICMDHGLMSGQFHVMTMTTHATLIVDAGGP